MNKRCLTLLVSVLIILSFGCSPSHREVNDIVQKLNADIQRNDHEIKNEMSAIKEDLYNLKSTTGDEVQKLNADVQKNSNQLENEMSAIKEDLDGLKSSLNNHVQELNAGIQDNKNLVVDETSAIKKEVNDLKSGLSDQIQELNEVIQNNDNQQESETSAVKKDLDNLKSELNRQMQELTTGIQENSSQQKNTISTVNKDLDNLKSNMSNQLKSLNISIQDKISSYRIYWIVILVILFIVAGVFFLLKYRIVRLNNMLSSKFNSSIEVLKNEIIQLDTKLVQVLERQLENGNLQLSQEAEPDHSLPIKVCEEIQRMRNRMKHMDQGDQATKVFRNRLESLEDKLNDMGYEMVNLENEPYKEGMTVKASFTPSENMKDGEKIITRVIKPQINYKNVLIQAAEVEVSMGA